MVAVPVNAVPPMTAPPMAAPIPIPRLQGPPVLVSSGVVKVQQRHPPEVVDIGEPTPDFASCPAGFNFFLVGKSGR